MTDDERFDEFLRNAAQDYHRPPEPPREAMWAHIEAARYVRNAPRSATGTARHSWRWVAGIAATLLLGVTIGRFTADPKRDAPLGGERQHAAPVVATRGVPAAYREVTRQHLGQAEALLTSFRAESRTGRLDSQVSAWARELLSTTRLLLDSPAATDAQLGRLLADLELVLAQIAQLRVEQEPGNLDLIDQAVEQRDVLLRLRTTTPTGTARAGT